MDEVSIIYPRHSWFKNIKLVVTPVSRTWKDKYTNKVLAKYESESVDEFSSREFEYCFSFLSTQKVDPMLALSILDTPINTNMQNKVNVYSDNLGSWKLVSDKTIMTYRNLFNLIGKGEGELGERVGGVNR